MVKDWLRCFAKKWGPAIRDTYYCLRHWYKMIGTFWKLRKAHLCMDKQIILKSSWNIISTIMTFANNMWNMWSSTCPGHLFNKVLTFQNCHPHPHPIPPGYVLHPIDRSCYHPQHKLHWNPAALPRHDLHPLRPLRVEFRWRGLGGPEPSNEWSCNHYKWP